ncbi:uncharacterized protein THITE_2169126, partial [Thermothielavioides terrestris NRRL 8126]
MEQQEDTASPLLTAPGRTAPLKKEAETSEPQSPGLEPSRGDPIAAEPHPTAHAGWNQGVSSGLRTSFAASSKGMSRKPLSRRVSVSPPQPDAQLIEVGSLAMPLGDPGFARPSRENGWQDKFQQWCVRLMALNKEQEGIKDAGLLREAWNLWLETRVTLSRAARTSAMQSAKDMNLTSDKLQEMFSEALHA